MILRHMMRRWTGVRRLEYVGAQIIETQGHFVKCLEDGSVTGMARQRLTQALTAASVTIYIKCLFWVSVCLVFIYFLCEWPYSA